MYVCQQEIAELEERARILRECQRGGRMEAERRLEHERQMRIQAAREAEERAREQEMRLGYPEDELYEDPAQNTSRRRMRLSMERFEELADRNGD